MTSSPNYTLRQFLFFLKSDFSPSFEIDRIGPLFEEIGNQYSQDFIPQLSKGTNKILLKSAFLSIESSLLLQQRI